MKKISSMLLALLMVIGTIYAGDAAMAGTAAAWQHLSDTEQAAGNALYDADTDTITFPNKTS
ncbi:MAG: hypothetical protein KHW79_11510, partial [Clostridiales bacterium]|nr:hypothetical protein [Clostridiales bacterium]